MNIVCPALGNPEMHPPIVGGGPNPPVRADRQGNVVAPDLSPVAEAACYFVSDASRFCNGTELVLDKGASAGMALDLPDEWFDPELLHG